MFYFTALCWNSSTSSEYFQNHIVMSGWMCNVEETAGVSAISVAIVSKFQANNLQLFYQLYDMMNA